MTVLKKQFIFSFCLLCSFSLLADVCLPHFACADFATPKPRPKGLKDHHAALKLAELISTVYELQRGDEASDQVKFLIREALDEQSQAGFLPIDVWGSLPDQTPRKPLNLFQSYGKSLEKSF